MTISKRYIFMFFFRVYVRHSRMQNNKNQFAHIARSRGSWVTQYLIYVYTDECRNTTPTIKYERAMNAFDARMHFSKTKSTKAAFEKKLSPYRHSRSFTVSQDIFLDESKLFARTFVCVCVLYKSGNSVYGISNSFGTDPPPPSPPVINTRYTRCKTKYFQ